MMAAIEQPVDFRHSRRSQRTVDTDLNRVPPYSEICEQGILGCILLNYRDSLDLCAQAGLVSLAMYDARHQAIYDTILQMDSDRFGIDVVTLYERLRQSGKLDDVGGMSYIANLAEATPSHNLDYYIPIVMGHYTQRRIINTASDCEKRAYDSSIDADDLLDQFERDVLAIRGNSARQDKTSTEVLRSLVDDLQQEAQGIFKAVVATGLSDFDRYYKGYSHGDLVILAARPSQGKTCCMLNQAMNIAKQGHHVGIISLEMTHESLCRRQLSAVAEFDLSRIGMATATESVRIAKAAAVVKNLPISVCDQAGMTIRQIASKARQWVTRHNMKVLMVDYLQLAHGVSKRSQADRRLEIGEISSGLKSLAKDLGIVVVALSQLNRKVEDRGKDSRPRMSDLLESGAIEADADWITFLWSGKQKEDEDDRDRRPITLTVAKNRNGRTGDVQLMFDKPTGRFLPITRSNEESYTTHP